MALCSAMDIDRKQTVWTFWFGISIIWTSPFPCIIGRTVDDKPQVQGAQVVARVARLLRLIANNPLGATTSWLAREAGLTRSTTHRLLMALAAEGLLDIEPDSGHWVLGAEVYLLGAVAAARFRFAQLASPS